MNRTDRVLGGPLYQAPTPFRMLLGGNFAGEHYLFSFWTARAGTYRLAESLVDTSVLCRVVLALRRHESLHGELPPDLAALVPTGLEPGVMERTRAPLVYDRDARWIGFDRPDDVEPVAAPRIRVGRVKR
ncbi:MAG: hypothetical protein KDC38_06415 [Planctomycetes bacterium]|nr:hypothetical protein [Planctomycetota bacterium]